MRSFGIRGLAPVLSLGLAAVALAPPALAQGAAAA